MGKIITSETNLNYETKINFFDTTICHSDLWMLWFRSGHSDNDKQ